MAITLFAAVSVGSYELEMKIFEISAKYGIKEIDRVSHIIELGRETYNNRKISFELADELCDVLYDFNKIMKSYKIKAYRACATSAIREAVNSQNIIDRIKVRTGFDVDILSNSEQRYISYKAFAIKEKNFDGIIEKGTLLIDMGAGSAQVTLFDHGSLITTQNIRLGALRIREMLGKLAKNAANYREIIEEYIDNDLETLFTIFMKDRDISNIIGTGENITYMHFAKKAAEKEAEKVQKKAAEKEQKKSADKMLNTAMEKDADIGTNQAIENELDKASDKFYESKEYITKDEFNNLYELILNNTEEQLAYILDISQLQASLIVPCIMLFWRMFDFANADKLWMPNVKLTDGLAVEYAQHNNLIKPNHDFIGDILSATRLISKRYKCNKPHTMFVEENSLKIFDAMKKYHGLGKRERLLMHLAATLHDCGKYVSLVYPAEAAFDIITSTEIIGLSHAERILIALVVKYNIMDYDYSDEISDLTQTDMYITVTKLVAILRVANALDKSHKQKMTNIKVSIEGKQLVISTDTYNDITLEKGLFDDRAAFFEEVYGIIPVIKQKKN